MVARWGIAGTHDEVQWQIGVAKTLGITEPGDLAYEREFWSREPAPFKHTVLPSRVIDTIKKLGAESFVARAGNGVIYLRGQKPPARVPVALTARLKSVFDPQNKLPALPL